MRDKQNRTQKYDSNKERSKEKPRDYSSNKEKLRTSNSNRPICFKCNKSGHYATSCPKPKAKIQLTQERSPI